MYVKLMLITSIAKGVEELDCFNGWIEESLEIFVPLYRKILSFRLSVLNDHLR